MQEPKKKKPEEEVPDYLNKAIAKRFLAKKQLGQGAHGLVYLGKDLSTEAPIAIKLVSNSSHFRWQKIKNIRSST